MGFPWCVTTCFTETTIAQNLTRSFGMADLRQNRPFTFARKIAANGRKTSTGRSGCFCS
jgi:hypothetical protein